MTLSHGLDVDGRHVVRTVTRRLVPLLFALYVANFVDRVNISVAALRMNSDLGMSATVYGLASGIFFLGYLAFQVPGSVMLHRLGARRWIAAMAIAWGICSAATAFVPTPEALCVVRFLLGVVEAGFFPGVISCLGWWFPARDKARAVSLFLLGVPAANVIGVPVAGLLVEHGAVGGVVGWRTMFVALGLPSVLLGLLVLRMLPDGPRQAPWLTAPERDWLVTQIANEHVHMENPPRRPVLTALRHRRLLAHAGVYAGLYFALYALQFFLPQLVSGLGDGLSVTWTSVVVALCYVLGTAFMLVWSRHSDHTRERIKHLALPAFVAAAGLALGPVTDSPLLRVVALAVALACVLAAIPVFWSLPVALPAGLCADAGVAVVNSLSSVASFVAPYVTGALKDLTGGYGAALLCAAFLLVLSGGGALSLGRAGRPRHGPAEG